MRTFLKWVHQHICDYIINNYGQWRAENAMEGEENLCTYSLIALRPFIYEGYLTKYYIYIYLTVYYRLLYKYKYI